MPPPGTLGSPMFEGANVTEFLERYKDLCSDYRVSDKDRLTRLPRYCIQPVAETIRFMNEWRTRDYVALKKVLLSEYRDNDTHQLLYSVPFLEKYKSIARSKDDDIIDYCTRVWFIHGLPLSIASRLIRKFAIDTEDPDTVNYQQQLEHVQKQAASDKAIRQMSATQNPSSQQAEVVNQVVEQLQPAAPVTEERPRELIVKSTTTSETTPKTVSEPASKTAVDQLAKAFMTFNVNLQQLVQP
jgi:hypothetical protein